ncbi:BREX system P-loop protein BrxC, partial [Pseudomonadota bacterium]
MTTIRSIFKQPIDRYIEGVVKADDESSLRQEVEEYVLTNEVAQQVEDFLDEYNNYHGANGAWISGFFGSGKSHLLKLMSMVLENKPLDGTGALELFLPKCADNQILKGGLEKAARVPSRSILFNIDQKADVISKTELDALVAVFVKVFDELCGYYDMQPHIAQFERELDEDGLLQDFHSNFTDIAGKGWEFARSRINRFTTQADEAYNRTTGGNATNIIDKFRQDYSLSIEDFANNVKDYIDRQESGFRLNFFVDEVGQYIAEHRKLMVNLQTVAESLATKCNGRSWVIVTSQQDMERVIGEIDKQQAYDFSKIMARFSNRLQLTSADVSEVINQRLLSKNSEGTDGLTSIYEAQKNNLKTLFDFAGGRTIRNYRGKDQFVATYPFIPYQYELFQLSILQLSTHNAFEGRHSSVGERSMLAVFKDVAEGIADKPLGTLATFDMMFEGIRNALKATVQASVISAERQLDDPFAIQVLKALFLVKYLAKEFHATPRNISILMRESFEQDNGKLLENVTAALDLLEQQTYIQRVSDAYEFLTDEEKDIEQEIKNTDVPTEDIIKELSTLIFDRVIRDAKITYDRNNQSYRFTRKIDGKTQGREYDLSINVITPLNDEFESLQSIMLRSSGLGELIVALPADDRLFRELNLYRKTDRYIRHNTSASQSESTTRILSAKAEQNRLRRGEIEERLKQILGRAEQYVDANALDIGGTDPRTRFNVGFNELISRTYPHLSMLRDISLAESDIERYIEMQSDGLFGNDATSMSEMEQEVMSRIQSSQAEGVRPTVKALVEHFNKRPYGWWDWASICILAMLYARGKIEVSRDVDILDGDQLVNALRNTHQQAQLLIEPQVEFTSSQFRNLKQFAGEFFSTPMSATEARALGDEISEAMKTLVLELETKLRLADNYPFLAELKSPLEVLKKHSGKSYSHYFKNLQGDEDQLLEWKEESIDPILSFINGNRKKIYDDCKRLLREQKDNFSFLANGDVNELTNLIKDEGCYQGQKMRQAKALADAIHTNLEERIRKERTDAEESIDSLQTKLKSQFESSNLSEEKWEVLLAPFTKVVNKISETDHIAVVREAKQTFETDTYKDLVGQLAAWIDDTGPEVESVKIAKLKIQFDKIWLTDEKDIDHYLRALRQA